MYSITDAGGDDISDRRSQLEDLVQQTLAQAAQAGASAAQAQVGLSAGLSVTVRLGEVESIEHQRDRGLGVTVYFGQCKGSASTSDWSPQAVRDTVEAACRIARYTQPDPAAGLADPERLARTLPELDLYHPWPLSPEQAIELARECEAAGRAESRITNSEGASVHTSRGLSVYGNSHGFIGARLGTNHSLSVSFIAGQDDEMQRDHWYTVARGAGQLEAAAAVGRHAAERAVRKLGASRLSTRQAPVLFSPEVARSLIGHWVSAVSGGSLYRKASFLLDAMGEPIFPAHVRIHEQPHLRGALGSAAFDAEGVATAARDLVSGGILQGYVLDSYSARRLGLTTTGNAGGVHNLTVEPGSQDFLALLKQMDTGLLVTELMGQGINLVTGDYSRGASGFWVQGGEIVQPVQEITIAGNLRQMFAQLLAVGADTDIRSNIRCGSLLIESMTIAGS